MLLFDLGGVVIELDGLPIAREWIGAQDEQSVWSAWIHSPAVRRFESGGCDAVTFAERIVAELRLPISPSEFLGRFERWPKGLFPGVRDLLASLRPRFRLACLTNCNAVHWPRFLGEMGLRELLDHPFSSHELRALKPDRDIFEKVVKELGCEPGRVLFLDDNQVNVDGALAAGLAARQVKGPAGIRAGLAGLGLL